MLTRDVARIFCLGNLSPRHALPFCLPSFLFRLPVLLLFPYPPPFLLFFPNPLPLLSCNPARSLGGRCKLPIQWGLICACRTSRHRFWDILAWKNAFGSMHFTEATLWIHSCKKFDNFSRIFQVFFSDSDAECLSSELAATLNINTGSDSNWSHMAPHDGLVQTDNENLRRPQLVSAH